MSSPRKIRVGDHVEHDLTGDYLGVVTGISGNGVVLQLDSQRKRDGIPISFCTKYEARKCAPPTPPDAG